MINKLKKGDVKLVKVKDHFKIRENNPFELKKALLLGPVSSYVNGYTIDFQFY